VTYVVFNLDLSLHQTLSPAETHVTGVSRYGDSRGDVYGTYVTGVRPVTYHWLPNAKYETIACVQVKCPGDVVDGSDVTPDVATEVELKIRRQNATCKFRLVSRYLQLQLNVKWTKYR